MNRRCSRRAGPHRCALPQAPRAASSASAAGVAPQAGDERHAIGLPGLPNLHSHAFQRGLAGLTERRGAQADSFWSWRELMYQFVERIDPERIRGTQRARLCRDAGGGLHPRRRVSLPAPRSRRRAATPTRGNWRHALPPPPRRTGIGLTLLPVFYAHSGFGGAAPAARQQRFISDPERFARLLEASRAAVRALPGATVGVAPHSLRAVTPAQLAAVLRTCARRPGAHPYRRAGARGRGLPRLERPPSDRVVAGERGRRCTLVPGACHAGERGRARRDRRPRRGGRSVPHAPRRAWATGYFPRSPL